MSHPDDHMDMGRDHDLDDRTAEELLRGRADAVGTEHRALAAALDTIRHAASARPRPDEQVQSIFAHGIGQDELAGEPASAHVERTRPAAARGRVSLRGSLAKVAGLSLLVKLTLGGMAVAAAGAGVAGVLPGQDRPDPAPSDESEIGQEVADEAVEEGGVDGQEISERVREPRGDEPGGQLPPHWSDRADDRGDERRDPAADVDGPGADPRDHAPEDADRGLDEADRRTGDAPARERSPDAAGDAREQGEEHGERRSGEDQAPAPTDRRPQDEQPGATTGSSVTDPSPDAAATEPGPDAGTDGRDERTSQR
jgi:hypothetical protein